MLTAYLLMVFFPQGPIPALKDSRFAVEFLREPDDY